MADTPNTDADADAGEAKDDVAVDKTAAAAKPKDGDKDVKLAVDDWRATITDEKVRKHVERYASPADVANAEYKSRQQLSNAVVPLGKDAKPDEVAAYHKKMGVPLNPEGYQFETPEGHAPTDFDKAFQTMIAKTMHENHIPASAARALSVVYNDFVSEIQRQVSENDAAEIEKSQTVLNRKWGSDFKVNVSAGDESLKAAAEATGNEQINELKNLIVEVAGKKILLGSVPLFLEYAAFNGRKLMEGQAHAPLGPDEIRSVQDELDGLYALNVSTKAEDRAKYRTAATQKRIQDLEEARVRAKKQKVA